MIKFFRRIRQTLLSEGKTGKYLKYAIGEILLMLDDSKSLPTSLTTSTGSAHRLKGSQPTIG
jgi:hypothetical protein